MPMKWISNINASDKHDMAWAKSLPGYEIGEPKETKRYTVQALKDMGIVGVYVPEQ